MHFQEFLCCFCEFILIKKLDLNETASLNNAPCVLRLAEICAEFDDSSPAVQPFTGVPCATLLYRAVR
jgi:hypothetical protein